MSTAVSALDGVIVVDKPEGWTSHDVVGKMRGIAGTRRVGHRGTLDPIATGVLPLIIGQATRLARFWNASEKCYEATIRFGFATSTYDREGEPAGPDSAPDVRADDVEACLQPLRGEIDQVPPPVSAKKILGVPAYKLARMKVPVEIPAVRVSIHEISLLEAEGQRARLRVRCSAGTYIRSIAHELGLALGCGAHIESLVRTRSGPFDIRHAHRLESLQELRDESRLQEALTPLPDLLPEFPDAFVDDVTVARIRQGRDFHVSPFRVPAGAPHVKALGPDGSLVAIGQIVLPGVYHPQVVFSTEAQ